MGNDYPRTINKGSAARALKHAARELNSRHQRRTEHGLTNQGRAVDIQELEDDSRHDTCGRKNGFTTQLTAGM